MGGSVGLKGTDGRKVIRQARTLGAVQRAPARATATLEELVRVGAEFELLTCAGAMGEASALACHLTPTVVYRPASIETTAEDPRRAAREMRKLAVDLILFAGGDGTARDVQEAAEDDVPALAVPAASTNHTAHF